MEWLPFLPPRLSRAAVREHVMSREYEPQLNVAAITDAEVFAAIRYLDADTDRPGSQGRSFALAICATVAFLFIACMALLWLYEQIL